MRRYTRDEWTRVFDSIVGERLPGMVAQGIHEVATVQRYVLGARLALDDRAYRYALAGGALDPDFAVKNLSTQHVMYTTVHTSAVVGATQVVIDVAATDGAAGNGAIAASELRSGYVVFFTHIPHSFCRKIITNTVVAVGGGVMTLTLDVPIPAALTHTTMHAECIASPYLNVGRSEFTEAESFVGVPTRLAAVGDYSWLQTWGPIWTSAQGDLGIGTNHHQGVFRHDGSIDWHNQADTHVEGAQHAGYMMEQGPAGAQGAPFFFLQIAP